MSARRLSLVLAGAALVALFSGCEDDTRTTAPPPPQGAFTPEQFADIPLPRGYVFSPGQDRLAVTLAGGAVRRFEVWMEQRETAEPQSTASLLAEMERDLMAKGWTPAPMSSDKLEWQKDKERLVLETGRTGGRSTIRLRLRPAPLVGP
jgi:hypothetical protein